MILIALFLVALITLYLYGTRTFNYWKDRGVKYEKPLPLIGNNLGIYLMRKSVTQVAVDAYMKYPNEKIVGFFRSTRPELVIRDPEIIKRILTTDFYHFYSRGLIDKDYIEPMMRNLFFADGDLWRLLRQRMTNSFTSGKLKAMFPLVCERAEKLKEVVGQSAEGDASTLDARDVMARYTTDFIGSVGFGLNSDSLSDENSQFRKLGKDIFTVTFKEFVVATLKELFPKIFSRFKYMTRTEQDVIDLVTLILKQRNYQPSGRNDFLDLMLECKNKGIMEGESIEKVKKDGSPEVAKIEMDDKLIAAQAFIFFAAGFETSSSATSYTLHQLAYNPEVQKKLQQDVDRVLAKHDNKLCYEAVKEMNYLEWTFKEGMRMFPSLGFLARECERKYTFEDLNVTIDPGVGIMIPLQALQNDPQYFENPEVFRPERFSPEEYNKEALKHVYLPFGEGPRACIGERLGLMQSMAGLAAILSTYTVEPAPETIRYPVVEPKSDIVQSIKGGLPLVFRKRKKNL